MKIIADFDKKAGKIKPFHAINNAPINGGSNQLFHYLKDANIPYSRLHDTGGQYGGSIYVDIENIFRNMDADPKDPKSYDFAFTDRLLSELALQGTKPFFRLGATIENSHIIKAYHIFPPEDNLKWAQICEGIIRHYNHGWANGFEFNIIYWEIWNEPDNEPEICDNPMWKGTKEQYFALYEAASNYLKKKLPYIKVGGYASCGFYALNNSFDEQAHSSPRTDYFIEFFQDFLKYISSDAHKSPFDFFSWHSYADSEANCFYADYVRNELDRYGFNQTESILNEWNPGIQRRGTESDACYISEMIIKLHKTSIDMLMYYDGQVHGSYQGLFDPVHLTVFPAYYALHSFGELYALGAEVNIISDGELPVIAAENGEIGKILIVNKATNPFDVTIQLTNGWHTTNYRILDGNNGLIPQDISESNGVFTVPGEKIVLFELKKQTKSSAVQ